MGILAPGDIFQDARFGLRQLARTPVLTAVVVLTLALGIGANTAIFSLVYGAMLQRLPVAHPEELRTVVVIPQPGYGMSNVPVEFFEQLRQSPRSFSGVCAHMRMRVNFAAGGDDERIWEQLVSGRYYATLGVPAYLGRTLTDADEHDRARVAVLSYPFWLRRFAGDPAVVGATVLLNNVPTTVVGVTPPGFFGTDRGVVPDITIPLDDPRQFADVWVTVRLAPGVDDRQALAETELALDRAHEIMRPQMSRYRASERDEILSWYAGLRPGGSNRQEYESPLRILMLLSAVLLLIACVNIANLLLARSVDRAQEIGVRLALGASRARLVRQLLTESALLAVLGAAAGTTLASWMYRGLQWLLMDELAQRALPSALDPHVFGYSLATSALAMLLFGLTPALRATRVDVWALLKRDARGGRGLRLGLARSLIVAQVAASMLLLFGAGLLARTFRSLASVDAGLPLDNTLTMRIGLSPHDNQPRRTVAVYREILARAASVPGVTAASLAGDFAFSSGEWWKSIWVEGLPPEQKQMSGNNYVSPGFFAASGIPLLRGREFTGADAGGAPAVAVVNQTFVRRLFPGRNPLGRHVRDGRSEFEVVGVVADVHSARLREPPAPMVYQALMQEEFAGNVILHVRTHGNPLLMRDRLRGEIRAIDARIPVYEASTLRARLSDALQQDRMMATLSAFFGLLALALAGIGVYGVIAHAVGRRTTEIGVRMALGATPADLRWMIVRETVLLVGAGAALGIPVSLAGAATLRATLFGVTAQDPATTVACVLVLLAAGCAAGYLPARRAASLEPLEALRTE